MAQAASSEWAQTGESGVDREAIRTWARSVEGLQVKAFKGVTETRHTVPEVLGLLADTPNLHRWVFNVRSSQYVPGQSEAQMYLQFKGVWPASDRDVFIKREVSQTANGVVLVESNDVRGLPEQEGFVRMHMLHNTFRLTPLPGQWTRVEFETQVDIGGLVPAWIANIVSTQAPRVTLEGLRQQMAQPKYQHRQAGDFPAGFLKGGASLRMPPEHLQEAP